jgi:small GTP-binding protein
MTDKKEKNSNSTAITQKILEIEAEMARTQKNKATEGHLGLLKAKLAKLRREQVETVMRSGGSKGEGFDVIKSGDARIGLIGFPSVGKSTLLCKLTDTYSEIQEREFTTLTCIPGVIKYRGSKLQLLDLPGIIEGAKDGKGKGRQVIGVARTCNLILVVLDALKPLYHKRIIENELEGVGIRLNRKKPDIEIRMSTKGGGILINRGLTSDIKMSDETITNICKEYKINNAEIVLRGRCGVDDLIDAIEGNRVYIPALYVINKIDQITIEELDLLDQIPNYVLISAHLLWNLDELLERIWEKLDLLRIYTKPKGQVPDYEEPVILQRNKRTVSDFCLKIHRGLLNDLKYAIVWGSSVKHQPMKVGKDHILNDEDVIQIVKKI